MPRKKSFFGELAKLIGTKPSKPKSSSIFSSGKNNGSVPETNYDSPSNQKKRVKKILKNN
jgi:hypothetical protein